MIRKIKELLADFLDSICSEDYTPANFKLVNISGILYVYPASGREDYWSLWYNERN